MGSLGADGSKFQPFQARFTVLRLLYPSTVQISSLNMIREGKLLQNSRYSDDKVSGLISFWGEVHKIPLACTCEFMVF